MSIVGSEIPSQPTRHRPLLTRSPRTSAKATRCFALTRIALPADKLRRQNNIRVRHFGAGSKWPGRLRIALDLCEHSRALMIVVRTHADALVEELFSTRAGRTNP